MAKRKKGRRVKVHYQAKAHPSAMRTGAGFDFAGLSPEQIDEKVAICKQTFRAELIGRGADPDTITWDIGWEMGDAPEEAKRGLYMVVGHAKRKR